MDIWKAATAPVRGIAWLVSKAREWWLQERAELEAAYEKEINILRERLSRATNEADRTQIERDIREAEDRYIQHLRDKVVAMSESVVRDRAPSSLIIIESGHLPPREGAALERAASTWAALEPPRSFEDRLMLGNAFHMAGDFERSLAEYDAALEVRPGDAEALTGRGYVLVHLDREEEAVQAFERSLASRPDDCDALDGLAWALHFLGRHEEALDAQNRALALDPDEPVLLDHRGVTLHHLKRYREALADYNRSLGLRPDDAGTLNNRGITLHALSRHHEALADYDRALELRPGHSTTLYNRGITLHHLKRYEEALADFNRCLELQPDNPSALYNRACALSLMGRYEDALADLREATARDGKYRAMAREDEDFEGLRNDPQWGPKFKELVETEE